MSNKCKVFIVGFISVAVTSLIYPPVAESLIAFMFAMGIGIYLRGK